MQMLANPLAAISPHRLQHQQSCRELRSHFGVVQSHCGSAQVQPLASRRSRSQQSMHAAAQIGGF